MEHGDRARLFVALPVPDPVPALGEYLAECRRLLPGVRWIRPEGAHITLQFLGWVDRALIEGLRRALAEIRQPPFELRTGQPDGFGPRRAPTVYWLAIGGDLGALHRLETAVVAATCGLGFEPEKRPYHPHLTLGRAPGGGRPVELLTPAPELAWTARELILYESRSRAGGPEYVPISQVSLTRK